MPSSTLTHCDSARPKCRFVATAVLAVAAVLFSLLSPAAADDRIYWTNADGSFDSIGYANLDGSGGAGEITSTGTTIFGPAGLAMDPANNRIYWMNSFDQTVWGTNLDGTGTPNQISTAGASTTGMAGLAIDTATGRLYWAAAAAISYANIDGSGGGTLATGTAIFDRPAGVAIDVASGRIYWTNLDGDGISYAALDGSGGGQLATTGATVGAPVGLAIDTAGGRIYWGNTLDNTIGSALLDGTGGGMMLPTGAGAIDAPLGIAIDADAGYLYWTSFVAPSAISRTNLDGSGQGVSLDADATAGADVTGPYATAVLRTPAALANPVVTSTAAGQYTCSSGTWADDAPGANLYRAPQSITYQWTNEAGDIAEATAANYTPTADGTHGCRVVATNHAGSASVESEPVDVIVDSTADFMVRNLTKKKQKLKNRPTLLVEIFASEALTCTVAAKLRIPGRDRTFRTKTVSIEPDSSETVETSTKSVKNVETKLKKKLKRAKKKAKQAKGNKKLARKAKKAKKALKGLRSPTAAMTVTCEDQLGNKVTQTTNRKLKLRR